MSTVKWLDWSRVIARGYPFNFVIGGRGIGKTYGLLKEAEARDWRYIYLRRTDTELELCTAQEANPFRALNTDSGSELSMRGRGKLRLIERGSDDPAVIGYGAALSTFGKLRGVDFSHITQIIYDEFVPPAQASRIPDEGGALLQLYETVNRNRELKGEPPVQLFALSNAINLASPVLSYLDLIAPIEKMLAKDREEWTDDARGVYIYLPRAGSVAAAKRDTALYRLMAGDFAEQNLDNRFSANSFAGIGRRNLREYMPAWAYEELYAYHHKSTGELYICRSRADCMRFDRGRIEGWRRYVAPYLREDIEAGRVAFCDYTAKVKLYNMLNLPLTIA